MFEAPQLGVCCHSNPRKLTRQADSTLSNLLLLGTAPQPLARGQPTGRVRRPCRLMAYRMDRSWLPTSTNVDLQDRQESTGYFAKELEVFGPPKGMFSGEGVTEDRKREGQNHSAHRGTKVSPS